MAGANYMGGKRNAAKARNRDVTGKAQKGFFSRQRLELLSKGLAKPPKKAESGRRATSTSSSDVAIAAPGAGVKDISLEHAKKRRTENSATRIQYSFLLSPKEIPERSSSPTHESQRAVDISSSKVLEALDFSQPIFFRSVIDKILSIPDLAGLNTRPVKPGAEFLTEICSTAGEKGGAQVSTASKSPPSSPMPIDKEDSFDIITTDNVTRCTGMPSEPYPMSETDQLISLSPHTGKLKPYSSSSWPESESSEVQSWSMEVDDAPDDIEFDELDCDMELDEIETYSDDNLDADFRQSTPLVLVHPRVTSSDVKIGACKDNGERRLVDYSSSEFACFGARSLSEISDSVEGTIFTSCVSFDAGEGVSGPPEDMYNLFNHSDPWHSIGVILGFEDENATHAQRTANNPAGWSLDGRPSTSTNNPDVDYRARLVNERIESPVGDMPRMNDSSPIYNWGQVASESQSNSGSQSREISQFEETSKPELNNNDPHSTGHLLHTSASTQSSPRRTGALSTLVVDASKNILAGGNREECVLTRIGFEKSSRSDDISRQNWPSEPSTLVRPPERELSASTPESVNSATRGLNVAESCVLVESELAELISTEMPTACKPRSQGGAAEDINETVRAEEDGVWFEAPRIFDDMEDEDEDDS